MYEEDTVIDVTPESDAFFDYHHKLQCDLKLAIEALRQIAILPSRTGSHIAGEAYRLLTNK